MAAAGSFDRLEAMEHRRFDSCKSRTTLFGGAIERGVGRPIVSPAFSLDAAESRDANDSLKASRGAKLILKAPGETKPGKRGETMRCFFFFASVLTAVAALSTSPLSGPANAADPAIDDLLRNPVAKDWVTNGGNLTNQRYSTLKQINVNNVKQLKGAWMTRLKGLAPQASTHSRRPRWSKTA